MMSEKEQLTRLLNNLRSAQEHLEVAKNIADNLGISKGQIKRYIWEAGIKIELVTAAAEGLVESIEHAAGQGEIGESD